MIYADIILPLPLDGLFTYSVPEGLAAQVRFGVRVAVPFGKTKIHVGVVVRVHGDAPQGYKVKPIMRALDAEPVVTEGQYGLWRWISDYYMSPVGEVYKAALPSGLKAEDGYKPRKEIYVRLTSRFSTARALHAAFDMLRRADKQRRALTEYVSLAYGEDAAGDTLPAVPAEITREELMNSAHTDVSAVTALVKRGVLETYEREVGRLNSGGIPHPERIKPLSGPQRDAYDNIVLSFLQKDVTLLHGVTSSGKTEIYIHLIQQQIDSGRQVLYLLPEIALTVQIMERLRSVFGSRLGIYHSKYSDAERVEIWKKQLSAAPYDIILGARSAVLLPFSRLGLVIVDEEHESSYKQQDPAPRYHARSTAIMLAHAMGAKTLLGTATPCMETYHNATVTGKYGYVSLTERYKGVELPEIQVVDVKDLRHRKMMRGPFSPLLLTRIREAIERGEQAILFQNRRGFAPMIECRQCGWVPRCEHCDVSLTFHRNMNTLTCHYCGFTYTVPHECPACGNTELKSRGAGTEKIEDTIREIFPEARVARMDLDTTRTRNAYGRIISDFSAGKTNILVGTQMISKGLDFGRVSVVGILDADSMMNYPDFRAYEQAYMMMAQVAGRAGRRGRRGLVILQTKSPDVPLIGQVVNNDYASLYADLKSERTAFRYPPFRNLIYIYLKHRNDDTVNTASIELGSLLRSWFADRVLGPDKPAVAKVKTLNIRKIVLKLEPGIDRREVRRYLLMAQERLTTDKRYASLQIYFDVDPG
ncbi:MAG: primosomal protein N' [Prevotella sp.]|uniref:replication restart helicase PriA n=1 Tax=Prevotella sp. PTAC TaxID=2736295 RepID=UPI001555BEF3|nr:primosomal protein N' [Prevotella sp. PTAC]MCX4292782.1 primosomal protein N' [Prevotella sp.]NPD54941.1 primosomal protein N' [Prevotella sp. PTAC]